MSDDGRRGRELDNLRRQYRDHREALTRMAADAPTEHLAAEYNRLISGIDGSLAKLEELEAAPGRRGTAAGTAAVPPPPAAARAAASARPHGDPLAEEAQPLSRPLLGSGDRASEYEPAEPERRGDNKFVLMLILGIPILALLGWLAWKASRNGDSGPVTETAPIAEEAAADTGTARPAETGTVRPVTPPPKAVSQIVVVPAAADFGVVGKGTRAVRQVEITNRGDQTLEIQVARSKCRCLYYEYKSKLEANRKETLTITLDGGKAQAGTIQEALAITSKRDPALTATVQVTATVQ